MLWALAAVGNVGEAGHEDAVLDAGILAELPDRVALDGDDDDLGARRGVALGALVLGSTS